MQKTADEMRISDWSSDVCSSDLFVAIGSCGVAAPALICSSIAEKSAPSPSMPGIAFPAPVGRQAVTSEDRGILAIIKRLPTRRTGYGAAEIAGAIPSAPSARGLPFASAFRRFPDRDWRSEEHTSELQSLMRISYAVFCLKKKNI